MGTAILVLRILLAAVFAVAAVTKALDPPGTRQSVQDFGLPRAAAAAGVVLLPAAELLVAIGLLLQPTARVAGVAGLALLLAFSVAIGRLIRRGEAPSCHCFGQLQSSTAGPSTLVRNLGLAALAAAVAVGGPGVSLAVFSTDRLALLATTTSTALLTIVVVGLWRENRALRAGGDSPTEPDRGLPRGSRLPEVELVDLDGNRVSLTAIVGNGEPTVLIQVAVECGPCHDLLPELVRWRATLSEALTMIVVSSGELEANRAFAGQFGMSTLLVSEGRELGTAIDVRVTPSAVLLDAAGRITGPPVLGAVGVEALVRSELQRAQASAVVGLA